MLRTFSVSKIDMYHASAEDYKNLSWVWGADKKIQSEDHCLASWGFAEWSQRTIFLSASNSHDGFFFLHTFWSPAFDFNVGVPINEACCFTLTSAILKVDVICDVAMMSTPNIWTTWVKWPPIQPMHWPHGLLFVFYPSHWLDKGILDKICQHWWISRKILSYARIWDAWGHINDCGCYLKSRQFWVRETGEDNCLSNSQDNEIYITAWLVFRTTIQFIAVFWHFKILWERFKCIIYSSSSHRTSLTWPSPGQ